MRKKEKERAKTWPRFIDCIKDKRAKPQRRAKEGQRGGGKTRSRSQSRLTYAT